MADFYTPKASEISCHTVVVFFSVQLRNSEKTSVCLMALCRHKSFWCGSMMVLTRSVTAYLTMITKVEAQVTAVSRSEVTGWSPLGENKFLLSSLKQNRIEQIFMPVIESDILQFVEMVVQELVVLKVWSFHPRCCRSVWPAWVKYSSLLFDVLPLLACHSEFLDIYKDWLGTPV